jgi:PTH1 family peptidyl-tRNA hydrolase
MIKLVTFLGNPGAEYAQTRHNIGWMLAEQGNFRSLNWQKKFKGVFAQAVFWGEKTVFLKPETFMNLSGESVVACSQFFKIKPEEILVVHDELEFDFGRAGFKKGGGLAGHNGLRSIAKQLGTPDFHRFRLGISRPPHGNVSAWVLSKFSGSEQIVLPIFLEKAAQLLQEALESGIDVAEKKYIKETLV